MRWSRVVILLYVLQITLATAAAQDAGDAARSAAARSLFQKGLAHADAGEWDLAIDRFRRAIALRDSLVIRYNLATSLSQVGRVVEASELLSAIDHTEAVDAAMREQVLAHLALVLPRIANLTVSLQGPAANVEVQIDDFALPPELYDIASPIDPGHHVIRALRAGKVLDTQERDLADGATDAVTLHIPDPDGPPAVAAVAAPIVPTATAAAPTPPSAVAPAAVAARVESAGPHATSPSAAPAAPADNGRKLYKAPWLWTAVGVVAAGAALGAVMVLGAGGDNSVRQEPTYTGNGGAPALVAP